MIELKPHIGYRRGNECDTGIDAVWLFDVQHPKGLRIGFAGREPGAPLQLTENGIAATIIAEARRELDARDLGYWEGARVITEPPEPIEGDEDDGNDDNDD